MAYQLGRILQLDFGFQGVAVTVRGETPDHGVFHYDPIFPSVTVSEMETSITEDDVLIVNPSFSRFFFGLRCPGIKVSYVQGFTTFGLLDCAYDLYVSVSEVVRRLLSGVWDIESEVVAPFISAETFPPSSPWRERPAGSILILMKGERDHQLFMREKVRTVVTRRHPNVVFDEIGDQKIPRRDLIARLGQYRYVVTLSAAEGFGLIPLEAMAMGATVLGFDGFGGRDYMRPGVNCAVVAYPEIDRLAEYLVDALDHTERAEAWAVAGRSTALSHQYTEQRFRDEWRSCFARLLARCAS
jgi:hypothetical protein